MSAGTEQEARAAALTMVREGVAAVGPFTSGHAVQLTVKVQETARHTSA